MKLPEVVSSPWAIQPEKLLEIQAIHRAHVRGDSIDIAAIEKRLGRPLNNAPTGYGVRDGVAVLPITGPVAKRMNMLTQISGGTSSEIVANQFNAVLNDPAVKAIVLSIDSPGGTVDGTQTLANAIYQARGKKPIVAWADGTMCSAAYWIGCAADSIYIGEDTAQVGSIGVVAVHQDVSGREAAEGVKTTEISAGKYKRVASQYGPLSADGQSTIQGQIDYLYSVFVGDVAKFRGVSEDMVLNQMADGRIFIGRQALSAGLVDGVATLDSLIASLKTGSLPMNSKNAPNKPRAMLATAKDYQAKNPGTDLLAAINATGKADTDSPPLLNGDQPLPLVSAPANAVASTDPLLAEAKAYMARNPGTDLLSAINALGRSAASRNQERAVPPTSAAGTAHADPLLAKAKAYMARNAGVDLLSAINAVAVA
jgi:capsid assembly protease